MIIKIFSDFCDSQTAKKQFEEYCQSHLLDFYGREKKIYITDNEDEEKDDYTHVVILNKAMPIIKPTIPIKNVIGLAFEPIDFLGITDEFIQYAQKNIYKYFIGDKRNLPSPFIEKYGYMFYYHPTKPIHVIDKKNIMSIVISHKQWTPQQQYRHIIVNNILLNNLPIDIYGNGCHLYKHTVNNNHNSYLDNRIKGAFDNWTKPYEEHYFTICIENFQSNQYFSEKIINPLMCRCTPIYLGCKNVVDYIGNDTMIPLTGNIVEDMNLIVSILQNPERYYKKIEPAMIDNKVNFLKNAEEIYK